MQRDEKEPLTIPKKPPDILIETLAIRSLLMFQKNPSIIYFSSIQKERAVEIIKSLLYSNPPFLYSPRRNHGSEIFHWFLYCLMNLLGVEDDKYDPYSLYFLELFQSKSTTATNFYKTIQTPIKTLIDFVNLLKFVEEYPSLYCALKPYCNLSFTKDEADDLLEKLQLPALSLFNDEIINSLDVVRIVKKTPIEIYSLSYAYTCLTFSKNYQILNTSIVIFPDTSQFIDDIILSAINTSLISQKHFADLIYKTSTTLFMSDKIEKALKAATIFPEYSDWVFTAIISRRMHDQNFLDRVLPNIQKIISKNSIFSDLVERISNDDNFYNTLKQTTGIYVEPKKYITESVPFIYRKYLINYNFDPFLSLSSQKLFIISDKNREIDNTFVCAFFVIFYIIKASETSSISNNNQLDVIIAKINETLCRIRECDRDKIIIDGFSLLFIKIRDRFIFSTNTASLIISELTSFAVSEKVMKLLKDSLKKLQITQSISNENDPQRIEDALVPIKSLVLKYLIMGDVEIAQRIAVLNPQLQLLLSDYKNLQIYRKSENYVNTLLQNENEENILSLHEIALCFHNDQEIIDRAYFYLNDSVNANSVNDKIVNHENNEINMELLTLLGERRNRIGKNLLKCVKKCKSERILKFNQILSNLSLTEWTKTKTITSKTPLFSGFVSYMNSIIPVLLETNSAKTVGEAISISHYEIITQLLKAKKFDIAEKIAKSFNTSIVDYVLSDPAIDRNYIQEILDPYPIVLITDKLMTFNKFDENDEYNQMNKYGTLKRFYLSKNKSKNIGDYKETFEYYDYSLQDGCGNSFFINSLKDLLNKNLNRSMNEKDIEILIEISYRLPSDEFVAIVESYLSKIDIISLGKTSKSLGCDFSFCEKVELLANIQLSIKEKPFPLKNSYSKLLSNREIKLAKEFLKFYRYEIDAIALTRKEILYSLHNNLPVIDLFEIIPNSRKEIIESLPIRYHSILDGFHSHFSENIPSHWKPASDPLTLLINNISDHKNVVEFLMSHSAVDFDVNFQQLLLKKSLNISGQVLSQHICTIHSNVHYFKSVFRSPEKVLQPVCKQLFTYVNLMKVHDVDSEMSCVKNLILIKDTLSECTKVLHRNSTQKESGSPNSHFFLTFNELYQNIICLCDFASIYPFSRYGIEYSFQNFSSKHIGEKLNIICFKLDMPDLANRISLGWHIKDTDHREKYALTCFSLGKYDTGLVYSPNRRRSTSETSAKQSEAFSMKLIDMFSRSFIYEIEMIAYLSQTFNILPFLWEFSENGVPGTIPNQAITNDLLPSTQHHYFSPQHKAGTRRVSRSGSKVSFSLLPELAQVKAKKSYIAPDIGSKCDFTSPHFYKRLLAISNTEMTFYPSVESNKMLRHFLKNYSKIGDQVNYFVSCGNFEKAFKYMSEMTTPQAKWTLFFDNIIFSAYSFNYESRMKYRIIESDPTMKEYGSYLEKLLSFSLKNKMPHLQLDLEMLLERSETAAITAIELSKKSSNLKESLSFLEIASNALNLELSGKKKKSKIPNKISIENLRQLREDVNLQKKFVKFCIDTGLEECSMNLFHGETATVAMVVYLFKEFQFNLALQITMHCSLSASKIAMKLSDIWVNEDDKLIIEFINELAKFAPVSIYEQILSGMLMRLYFIFGNNNLSLKIISQCVADPDFQCKLLIQFMQIEDAYKIAKNSNLKSLLPLIGHLAQSQNLSNLVNEVNRLLSK